MKKIIMTVAALIMGSSAFADPAKLSVKISGAENKPFFLCLYGAGCFNIHSGDRGRTFNISSKAMTNLKQVFVADLRTRKMHAQTITDSCNIVVNENQKVTVLGKLAVKNSVASIENMRCVVSS